MTLYDTAGIERHMSTIPQTYFRWSKVNMLVYAIDDSDTFDSLTNWAENAVCSSVGSPMETITVLVGNKLDLEDSRAVDKSRAEQYADNNDIDPEMVFEVSAQDGTGVAEMFNKIALKMTPTVQATPPPRQKKNTFC
jgi:GTPase SAR1 family protein